MKYIIHILLVTLIFSPSTNFLVQAEEVNVNTTADIANTQQGNEQSVDENSISSTSSVNVNQPSQTTEQSIPVVSQTISVQETFNTQEGGNSSVLENTPVEVTDIIIDASGGEDAIVPDENTFITMQELETDTTQFIQNNSEQRLTIRDLKPKTSYRIVVTHRTIVADKFPNRQEKDLLKFSQKNNLNTLNPIVDESTGNMSFSGSCTNKYFVVLLYKSESDYSDNPNSYILNKAFDCINNSFSYTISQLPESLPSGTYYLLVGEQGDVGTWEPISSLAEITLN